MIMMRNDLTPDDGFCHLVERLRYRRGFVDIEQKGLDLTWTGKQPPAPRRRAATPWA